MPKCPNCSENMLEHTPFDPDTLRRGLFSSWRPVFACPLCGEVESSAILFSWPALPAPLAACNPHPQAARKIAS